MTKKHTRTGRKRIKPTNAFGRWVEETGLTYAKMAERLGCSSQAVSNMRNGQWSPGRELANKIASLSAGAVPVASWDRPKRRAA